MRFFIYHGTTEKKFKEIIKTHTISFKKRPDHWLGGGVYFFINDYVSAFNWSHRVKKDPVGCVLKYDFEINPKYYLDLDSQTGLESFNEFVGYMESKKYAFEYSEEEQAYIKKNPEKKNIVLRSKYLELFYNVENIKACSYTFSGPFNSEIRSLGQLGLESKSRQLVVVDPELIDISQLKRVTE